jgi:hypothetical protein
MLRRCATSLGNTSTALDAFHRRLQVRIGKAKAIAATPASSQSCFTGCCPAA